MSTVLHSVPPAPHAHGRTAPDLRLRRLIHDLLAGLRGGALLCSNQAAMCWRYGMGSAIWLLASGSRSTPAVCATALLAASAKIRTSVSRSDTSNRYGSGP